MTPAHLRRTIGSCHCDAWERRSGQPATHVVSRWNGTALETIPSSSALSWIVSTHWAPYWDHTALMDPRAVRVADFNYAGAANEFTIAFWFRIASNVGAGGHTLFNHGTMWGFNNVAVAVLKNDDAGNGEIWTYVTDENDGTAGFGVAKPANSTWAM